jgi:hypothetical protein
MICDVVILDWVRLSVDLVFRALFRRLWIKGDLNLNFGKNIFQDYDHFFSYFGVSGVGFESLLLLLLLFKKLSVDSEVGKRLSEME